MRISKTLKEARILFLIGLIDLLLTLTLFNIAGFDAFVETNNIFSKILAENPYLFALAKAVSLIVFLFYIESTRQCKFMKRKGKITDKKAKIYLKIAIVAYVGLWILLVIKTNILPLL